MIKSIITKSISNTPAMNTLMIGMIAVGMFSLWNMRREVFPEFELEMILVTVTYQGASPEEVEEGICQKMEEAVRSIDGIKNQIGIAKEGSGAMVLELDSDVDVRRVLSEVRSEIERIETFPELADDPEIKQITLRQPAINVSIIGPESDSPQSELQLRNLAEAVRNDLLQLGSVSQADIFGAKEFEIDVEISEATLRRHNLSLQQVAQLIRRENFELPGGTIRTEAQDVLVKSKHKRMTGEEIAKIPLITEPNGVVLTVGDLGTVHDEFADVTSFTRINGKPAVVITVQRTSDEDLIKISDDVRNYVAEKQLPPGYEIMYWADRSLELRDRLELLASNGWQGLILVLVLLALVLEFRLAFWAAVGIPISILAACGLLYFTGGTLNMLTSFAFVMALGIVVDDAIVISENIHCHRKAGASPLRAAIDGTTEVLPSVITSVLTTVIAFVPLMFVSGVMGKFIAVMPTAMIATLLASLLEATFVLPCHLAHDSDSRTWSERARQLFRRLPGAVAYTIGLLILAVAVFITALAHPLRRLGALLKFFNRLCDRLLDAISTRYYAPVLRRALRRPVVVVSIGATLLLLSLGLVQGGIVPFVIFPKIDSNTIEVQLTFTEGTPAYVTDEATKKIEAAILEIGDRFKKQGRPVVSVVQRSVGVVAVQQGAGTALTELGEHLGSVVVELVDAGQRDVKSDEIINQWRKAVGEVAGAEKLVFQSAAVGPAEKPIEFKMLARNNDDLEQLEQAVEEVKTQLNKYPDLYDITDDAQPGKWEYQLRVKPDAVAMGVPLGTLAETVRASYHGEEVQRLQRGRHEVKLMVRYPEDDRRSLANFDQIRVRTGDGAERPLSELADVVIARGYSEINRLDQMRAITISADIDETSGNARDVVSDLQNFMPGLLKRYPNVTVRWEGQHKQTTESINSLLIGLSVALVAIFVVLTLEFTSYFQPLLIIAIIPFGMVGAVAGHAIMGLPVTLFSLFGIVALTGVVVNDSIVLIDFINSQVRSGVPLEQALVIAGQRRLRPIFLTSATTILGLLPLLLEQSFQAQILVPMAVSLCFGLLGSTVLCLYLVPTFYLIHAKTFGTGLAAAADPVLPNEPPSIRRIGHGRVRSEAAGDAPLRPVRRPHFPDVL